MPAKRKAEARRWLQQALYDLKAARWNIQGGFHISPLGIRTVFPAGTHTGSTANQWRSKPWLQPNGSSQSSETITRLKVMGRSWHRKTRLLNEH